MRRVLAVLLLPIVAHAQINWKNYSTSFQGSGKEGSRPTLVTAIPYNGRYYNGEYSSVPVSALPIADSLRNSSGKWPQEVGKAWTYDSSEVYFLAPGLHPANAHRYEYRVIGDGHTIIRPWSTVTRFTDPGIRLNEFKDDFGFLGGYKTNWDHTIEVDLREKATREILSSCIVLWVDQWPQVEGIYTSSNLPNFIWSKSSFGSWKTDSALQRRLLLFLHDSLKLQPGDNSIILHLSGELYQDTALEYQLSLDGSIVTPWRPNRFNNDMLLLQDLKPGAYTLQLRLRASRHNVANYRFSVLPAWYQTKLFQFTLGALQVIAIGAVILLLTLVRQRRKTQKERAAREKTTLELRAIRSQLNPHFIFNALSSIQGLVNNKDTDAANRYLSEFGSLLRESLATSENDLTELQREIALLDTYLKLEQLRFGFHYTIDVAPDIPDTSIPTFLLQPLIENAVKHGVASLHDQGLIQLNFFRQNTTFIARITDNGKGWQNATTGYGLKLTHARIHLLNELHKSSSITLVLPTPGQTPVTIELRFLNWWI